MITIKFSEVTGAIYAECGHERRNVTDDIIKAMEETGRLPEGGRWEIHPERDDIIACSVCEVKYTRESIEAVAVWGQKLPRCCPNCGARLAGESEDAPKKFTVKSEDDNIPDNIVVSVGEAVAPQKVPDLAHKYRQLAKEQLKHLRPHMEEEKAEEVAEAIGDKMAFFRYTVGLEPNVVRHTEKYINDMEAGARLTEYAERLKEGGDGTSD